jgi:hypothetical protein
MLARLGLVAMTALLLAPPVAADPGQDAAFFQILDRYKLGYTTRDEAISAAAATCSALDRGVSYGQLQTTMLNASQGGSWTLRDADQFMFAAISAYCPQYVGSVPQSSLVPR